MILCYSFTQFSIVIPVIATEQPDLLAICDHVYCMSSQNEDHACHCLHILPSTMQSTFLEETQVCNSKKMRCLTVYDRIMYSSAQIARFT